MKRARKATRYALLDIETVSVSPVYLVYEWSIQKPEKISLGSIRPFDKGFGISAMTLRECSMGDLFKMEAVSRWTVRDACDTFYLAERRTSFLELTLEANIIFWPPSRCYTLSRWMFCPSDEND